ncbi:unnamed protein product [Macrosiphum euphorbiae]|uniref:Uncharacterized protein n=1 Tax=Macrosiphum euphorbiae TaxID=13131 RepID=A0AAV0WNW9_9HEMI|nr:unnamed protein product [Macrosiphum euphorbiae]
MVIEDEYTGQINTEHINTDIIQLTVRPREAIVKERREGIPNHDVIRDSDFGTEDEQGGIRVKKRKKDSDALNAARTVNLGISQDVAIQYDKQVRSLGKRQNEIITGETVKKKIAVAVIRDLQNVKTGYQELVDELVLGRLWEARASD